MNLTASIFLLQKPTRWFKELGIETCPRMDYILAYIETAPYYDCNNIIFDSGSDSFELIANNKKPTTWHTEFPNEISDVLDYNKINAGITKITISNSSETNSDISRVMKHFENEDCLTEIGKKSYLHLRITAEQQGCTCCASLYLK